MRFWRKELDEFNFIHEWCLRNYRNVRDEMNKSTGEIEKAKMAGYLEALSHISKMIFDAQQRLHDNLIEDIEDKTINQCWLFKYLPKWMKK